MMKLWLLILGRLVLQIVAEELETCVTKEACLADVDKSREIASERFMQRLQRAEDVEEELTEAFKANVTAFNNDVENASPLCHNHMILGESAVITALEDSYLECREEIGNYPEADMDVEKITHEFLMNDSPNEDMKEEWTQEFCEWYPQFVNYYCGYFDHQYEIIKNGCSINSEFKRLYVSPWQDCVAQAE